MWRFLFFMLFFFLIGRTFVKAVFFVSVHFDVVLSRRSDVFKIDGGAISNAMLSSLFAFPSYSSYFQFLFFCTLGGAVAFRRQT